MLARLVCERRDELAADLMETYHVCLDEAMEGRYGATFVAALADQLPTSCRWRVSYDKDAWWNAERLIAAATLNNLRGLIWGLSKKEDRGPEPEPIGPSWAKQGKAKDVAMDAATLMSRLSRPRKGAKAHG